MQSAKYYRKEADRADRLSAGVGTRETEELLKRMARRRALPAGGEPPEDFVFERIGAHERPEMVKLFKLFGEQPSILLYSFMFGLGRDEPCTGCTHTLDGLDGSVFHADRRFPTYVVAKPPIARLQALARSRGWRNLQLLSTAGNDYSHHYFGDTSKFGPDMRAARGYEPGKNWDEPMYNVFRKDADGRVRHFWGSEMLYVQPDPGQNHRAGDLVDPVWGLLDMSPEGRGAFFPKLSYS